MVLAKQDLIIITVIMIIVGGLIWLIPWPSAAEPATNVLGQIIFWLGIALLILWVCLIGYHHAKSS